MASVRKRRPRKGVIVYQAVWYEAGPGGSRRQRSKNFARRADAGAYAAKMAAEVERRGVGDPQHHTVERYLRRWLARLADTGSRSPTTLQHYALAIAIASRYLGHVSLARLTAADLDFAYARMLREGGKVRGKKAGEASRPLTARTVLNIHRCLHVAFEQARKWKLIPENPARDATAPTPEKSIARAFTKDEVARLLDAAAADSAETYCIVAVLLSCGLRRSELLGLAFDAIDFDADTLEVRRTVVAVDHRPVLRERMKTQSSRRTLAISPSLSDLLRQQLTRVRELQLAWGREYQRDPLFVFPGHAGTPMIPSSLTHRLRRLMRRAGVTGAQPTHGWRHTCGTSLLHDGGGNIKTAQHRLGHSTPAITLALYVHPDKERDREAAEHFGRLISR